jgi:hypothetical protein
LRTTLSEEVQCFSSRIIDMSCRHNGCKDTRAEANTGEVVVEYNAAHDSQALSWVWTGASQCIHDLLPARRVELDRGARVALKRWQMLLWVRRASEGQRGPVDALAFQSRLTSGRRLWRASQIPA